MAVKLISDESNDAQITDGIVAGDVSAAGRLWVRFWPIGLASAREFVESAEVPGLAAEALIGTIASIAVGRGPREDVARFVRDAVRELGEDDEPMPGDQAGVTHPDVFASPLLSEAFAGLSEEFQSVLWDGAGRPEAEEALTALQSGYLQLHAAAAGLADCRQAHHDLAESVRNPTAVPAETWVHLSSCAWCTEAFHELAFSSVAITALVDPALVARAGVIVPEPVEVPVVESPAVAAQVVPLSLFADAPSATDPVIADAETAEIASVDAASAPAALTLPAARSHVADAGDPEVAGRRRRLVGMIAGIAAAAVIAIAVIAIAASSQGSTSKTPPSAGTGHTHPTTLADITPPASPSDSPTTPSPTPTQSASVAVPTASPTPAAVVANPTPPANSPTAKASDRPTTKPKPTPTPAPTPTPTPPSPSPTSRPTTPAPKPTPTPTCNPLAHLLGFC